MVAVAVVKALGRTVVVGGICWCWCCSMEAMASGCSLSSSYSNIVVGCCVVAVAVEV